MSNKFLVYLAGPISDTSYKDSMEWREYARARLSSPYVSCLSPMRDKESICESKAISKSGYNDVNVLLQPKGIITRDRHDCFRSDVILANLLGSVFPSIGTMIEFGWADSNRIPIVYFLFPWHIR